MKIYKSNKILEKERDNILDIILESNKTLEERLMHLINSYSQIKLTPIAESKLIGLLFD
mgnify:CR=1 FL=1